MFASEFPQTYPGAESLGVFKYFFSLPELLCVQCISMIHPVDTKIMWTNICMVPSHHDDYYTQGKTEVLLGHPNSLIEYVQGDLTIVPYV